MPIHYAFSDAAIVVVAIWASLALFKKGQLLPTFAMACFGIAAAIGVVRIGGNLDAELAQLHSEASQLLGTAGALALAATWLPLIAKRNKAVTMGAILLVAAVAFFFAKPLIAPLLLLALIIGCGVSVWRALNSGLSALVPVSFVLVLVDNLFVRRAPWLSEASSWHAYHVLIAIGLALQAKVLLEFQHAEMR
jgi:hypothetical protein